MKHMIFTSLKTMDIFGGSRHILPTRLLYTLQFSPTHFIFTTLTHKESCHYVSLAFRADLDAESKCWWDAVFGNSILQPLFPLKDTWTLELVFFFLILIPYETYHTIIKNTLPSCLINSELITYLHLRNCREYFSAFM